MDKQKFKAKKSLGQNFLKEKEVINSIIETADLQLGEKILEIGPGQGALTDYFVNHNYQVQVVELDQRLIGILEERYKKSDNITILHKDFLLTNPTDFTFLKSDSKAVKMIANLPYYITTPIIIKTLEEMPFISNMIIMVQKEVALRFCSEHKSKTYGSITVFLQTLADVKYEFTVDKTAFEPAPKIDSAIITLKRKTTLEPVIANSISEYSTFLKKCFSQKRKILSNNLKDVNNKSKNGIEVFLQNLGYPLTIRPEEISVQEYIKLYEAWQKWINK